MGAADTEEEEDEGLEATRTETAVGDETAHVSPFETIAQRSSTIAEPTAALALEPGEVVAGRYRIEALLGRGGFGEVYRVADMQHGDAPRALKLHRLGQATGDALDSLKAEFALLRTLSHPNLAKVHDFGYVDESVSFFTQDLALGERLDRSGLRFESEDMLRVLAQLCRALAYLHGRGILHGDIKPSNVLVDETGKLVLLDFGIARAFGSGGDGSFAGTFAYAAPEVITGRAVDARADLYSFGILLYQLASGRPPFRGRGPEVLRAHLFEDPPPLVSELPEPIRNVISRLIEKNPGVRPSSAASALEELSAAFGFAIELETEETLVSALQPTRLVGLEPIVEHLIQRCLKGRMTEPVALLGSPGTGKSTVLREVQHRVQIEGGVWVGLRVHREDAEALFERLAKATLTPAVVAALSEDDRRELARAYPWLRLRRERFALSLDPDRARASRLDALARALVLRFRRAGALAIDDVQRLDDLGRAAVVQLVERLPRGLIQVVISGRTRLETRELAGLLGAEVVEVPPLGSDDAWALVEQLLGLRHELRGTAFGAKIDAGDVTGSYVETALRRAVERDGLRRLGARWSGEVPAGSLTKMLRERLLDLDAEALAAALDMAVLGRPTTVLELSEMRRADVASVARTLHVLDRAGMMDSRFEAGRRVYELDERYASAVLRASTDEQRRQAHLRAGQVLRRTAGHRFDVLARAAGHLASAGQQAAATTLYERAAASADRAGLPSIALGFLQLAHAEATTERLLWQHDLAERAVDRESRAAVLEQLDRIRGDTDPAMRSEIDERRARSVLKAGDVERARSIAGTAIEEARDAGLDKAAARLELLAAEVEWLAGAVDKSHEHYRLAAEAGLVTQQAVVEAQGSCGASLTALLLGDLDAALSSAESAARLASRIGDSELQSEVQRQLGSVLRAKGSLRKAAAAYRRAIEHARRVGSLTLEAKALNNLGTVELFLDNPVAAEEAFRRSVTLKERAGDVQSAYHGYVNIGCLLLATGRPDEAERMLLKVLEAVGAGASIFAIALHNYGDVQVARGKLDEAVPSYLDAVDQARTARNVVQEAISLASLARAALMRRASGDAARAQRAVARLDEIVQERDVAEGRRLHYTTRAMWHDSQCDRAAALADARLAKGASDRDTSFSDLMATRLEARFIHAVQLERHGRHSAAQRELERCRRRLRELAQRLPEELRPGFMQHLPLHRAIVAGDLNPPPGAVWRNE